MVWKFEGAPAQWRFAGVHHAIATRTLAAPLHRHHREDEYSYDVTGRLGALLGDEWHTFRNPGDDPCKIIEVISPAGFEGHLREFREAWPDRARAAGLRAKYAVDIDLDGVPVLRARFGLGAG